MGYKITTECEKGDTVEYRTSRDGIWHTGIFKRHLSQFDACIIQTSRNNNLFCGYENIRPLSLCSNNPNVTFRQNKK